MLQNQLFHNFFNKFHQEKDIFTIYWFLFFYPQFFDGDEVVITHKINYLAKSGYK
jgi:hypothetical protein